MVNPMLLYTCKEVKNTDGQEKTKEKREPDQVNNTTANSTRNVLSRVGKFDTGSQVRGRAKALTSSGNSIAHLLENMKSEKFSMLFLVVAWVIFIASEKSIYTGMLMMLAGAYALCEVIPQIWRCARDAKRKP